MYATTQLCPSNMRLPQCGSPHAGGRSLRRFETLALCLLGMASDSSIAFARSARLPLRVTVQAAPACSTNCVNARGRISCPNFLTTTDQWPCAQYWMVPTACGWQLQRVFMCR
jgi:hypothetical protein